ncbi:hypothetical protein B2J88_48445 [Rhodococcus sp. SRB_17]|uniref:hypothetical protein n=1 Tax=Acidovorax sp. SRB_24 TaxID=1962700 RepID=UPI00145F847D|nr:hypothetical protein [Acidovorax sp. SRB_24]NMM78705.1 hypothetical protein [Acidovorax sp. SRB_24]NMM92011.1 hypothetical protein [Rhodococcus sp. SRB_17]
MSPLLSFSFYVQTSALQRLQSIEAQAYAAAMGPEAAAGHYSNIPLVDPLQTTHALMMKIVGHM